MRLKFVCIVLLLKIMMILHPGESTAVSNYYKDYLRGKPEDEQCLLCDGVNERLSYFYRTPAGLGARSIRSQSGAGGPNAYGGLSGNAYKNHMLNREIQDDDPRIRKAPVLLDDSRLLHWILQKGRAFDYRQ